MKRSYGQLIVFDRGSEKIIHGIKNIKVISLKKVQFLTLC